MLDICDKIFSSFNCVSFQIISFNTMLNFEITQKSIPENQIKKKMAFRSISVNVYVLL